MIARADLDEAVGYQLAAALHKVERAGCLFGSQLSQSTARSTLAALPRPDALQGGAEHYYREVGLLK